VNIRVVGSIEFLDAPILNEIRDLFCAVLDRKIDLPWRSPVGSPGPLRPPGQLRRGEAVGRTPSVCFCSGRATTRKPVRDRERCSGMCCDDVQACRIRASTYSMRLSRIHPNCFWCNGRRFRSGWVRASAPYAKNKGSRRMNSRIRRASIERRSAHSRTAE
jgi:hypothetical protein